MNNIGIKIKNLRKSLKLTQDDLSCTSLSRCTLSKIETGRLIPSIPQLEYLAEKLNVPIEEFFKTEDSCPPSPVSYNKINLSKLYNDGKYFDVIENTKPFDFLTFYYVGMSYYNIDLKKESANYLKKCETLFKSLNDNEKTYYVEKLCNALNTLRKVRVKDKNSDFNKKYIDKILYYLNIYNMYNYEIFYSINNNLAVYYLNNLQYMQTINLLETLINKNIKSISLNILPYMHLNLSIAYFAICNYEKSKESLENAIFFFKYIKDFYTSDLCYINLFNCYLYEGNFDKCYDIADNLISKNKGTKLEERFKNIRLIILYNDNKINSLQADVKKININKLPSNSKIDYYYILGRLNTLLGNHKTVVSYYKKCIKYLTDHNRYVDLFNLYSDMYEVTGDNNYNLLYKEYKDMSIKSETSPTDPDITSPHCIFGLPQTNPTNQEAKNVIVNNI